MNAFKAWLSAVLVALTAKMRRLVQEVRQRFLRAPKRWSAVLVLIPFLGYALSISIGVVIEFEERRWDVPAGVYAAPLELYAGLDIAAADLSLILDQLGYQRVAMLRHPGEYRVVLGQISLWTRPFQFWDRLESAQQWVIHFEADRITIIRDALEQRVPLLRLEPMRLGSIFATHHEDRLLVEPEAIPPLLIDTLQAVEDRKFESHHGLDFAAIVRAAWVNLRHGEIRQGGSTLTQQLVKSYFLDRRKTFSRKVREAIMAVALELRYDKQELIHAYVNEIYLGQQGARAIHGFGLASEFYFAKHLSQLELHEIALLVALVKGPSYYDPRRHADRATKRRNWVLTTLATLDIVDPDAAKAAAVRDLDIAARTRTGSRYQPAYMDLVRRQLASDYPIDDLATRGLRVFTSLDPRVQAHAERQLATGLARLQLENGDEQPIEGAVIVTHPPTGEVVAMVGGRRVDFDGFNRALNAQRPVGSLIKPFVYLAALQSGDYTLASTLNDEPIEVLLENGDTWAPQNFSEKSHGKVSLIRALAASYNQATVQLGLAVGVESVATLLQDLGLNHKPAAYPSLLLGAIELSPFDVAQLYNSLANGGFRIPLRAVRSVVDTKGQPLVRYALELEPAASTDAVQQLNQALVQAVERGTGRPAKNTLPENMVVAGKTGTSDEFRDSWFAGFGNNHLAVVWVGRDDNKPIGLTGSAGALTIWAPIIANIDHGASYHPSLSSTLKPVWIDYHSGLATRKGCGDSVFVPVPTDVRLNRLPGCGSGLEELGSRVLEWLDNVGTKQ